MPLSSLRPISPSIKRGKQQVVITALTRLARELGPGTKLPTTRELSRALGITGATLTRCLERMEIQGILHCRQSSGIYVSEAILQRRVALVFGEDIFSPSASQFGAMMLKHCAQRAESQNERFSFFLDTSASLGVMNGVTVPAHQDLADALKDQKLDGIILMIRSSVEQEAWLRSHGIPVVAAEASLDGLVPGWETVIFDYQKLIDKGVNRLLDAGCKTIGILGALREHREMFQKTLARAGLEYKPEWDVCSPAFDPSRLVPHEQFGIDAAHQFLDACNWNRKSAHVPDRLLITDDMLTRGALSVFAERGLEAGRDITICSHANKDSGLLEQWPKSIRTILFNPEHMATGLFEMLETLMSGRPHPSPYLISPVVED